MKKFLPFILIAGVVAVLWYVLKGKKVPGVATTATEAQAIIDNPQAALDNHVAYIERHPSSVDIMDQIDAHLLQGSAEVEDIIRAETELSVYAQYTRDGGTKTYEDFIINDRGEMPVQYKAQIDAAKAAATSYAADQLISGYQTTDAYGNVTGIRMTDLAEYVEGHSKTSATMLEVKSRFPEVFMVSIPDQPAPTISQEVTSPAKVSQPEPPRVEPEPFAATGGQLDKLMAEVGTASNEYDKAIDKALEAVKIEAEVAGGTVGWSSEGGYYVVEPEPVRYSSPSDGGGGGSTSSYSTPSSAGSSVGGSDSFRYT